MTGKQHLNWLLISATTRGLEPDSSDLFELSGQLWSSAFDLNVCGSFWFAVDRTFISGGWVFLFAFYQFWMILEFFGDGVVDSYVARGWGILRRALKQAEPTWTNQWGR